MNRKRNFANTKIALSKVQIGDSSSKRSKRPKFGQNGGKKYKIVNVEANFLFGTL